MIVCYLGPAGTSDHRAIELLSAIADPEPLPMSSVREIIQTVNFMPGCFGIVPLEDSTNGELTTILDRLIFEVDSVLIREEVVLVEDICAFGTNPDGVITTVVSHPLILDLCSQFIKERGLATRHTVSTAEACKIVKEETSTGVVALAPPGVGQKAGLEINATEVLDTPDIRTRYVLIGREVAPRSGDDKTSVVITPSADRVGFLAEVAARFAKNNVNMTSILSRPLQAKIGNYAFHITCEGHISDSGVQGAISDLLDFGASVKLLGSYPRWKGIEVTTPASLLPLGSVASSANPDEISRLRQPKVAPV
ncbi:MAG: ACT domain-containing protein [Acidimicrobiaceae bacterium]|nr:ACT domain-containing protein [Acidimicrobiaceae bacterium]